MKKFIKAISFTLSVITIISSLCFISCDTQNTQKEQEKIALTKENISDYLTIDDEVLDYNIDVEYEYILGFRVPNYDDSYGKAQIVINKKSDNLSFEDVELNLRVSVNANNPYPWEFKNNNSFENLEFDGKIYNDSYENCTYLELTIPYTGEYSKALDLVIGYNEHSKSVLETSDLKHITIQVVSVSGYVIIE